MNHRIFMTICLLVLSLAYSAAWAQGAAKDSVVTVKDKAVIAKDSAPVAKDSAPVAKDSAPVTKDSVAIAKDSAAAPGLDLDKLLSTEDDDLLIGEKPTPAAATAAADSSSISEADGQPAGVEAAAQPADSAVQAATPSGRRGPPSSARAIEYSPPDSAGLGPAVVEEGRAINFAQNLKDYKSPRVAMLLSLLVPGLGQAYSRNYVKAGAFGATEVAAIGVALYFNSVAKSKKRDAHRFADAHFDTTTIRSYADQLRGEFVARWSEAEGEEGDGPLEVDEADIDLPYDSLFFIEAAKKSSYYYERIGNKDFTPGWDDCDPTLDQILSVKGGDTVSGRGSSRYWVHPDEASFYKIKRLIDGAGNVARVGDWALGYSDHQDQYNAMVKNANSYNDAVNYTVYAMLLNHIASAIDAGFTARAYNAMLLGKESVWNRVSVEQQFVFTGSEVSPGLALRLRF